MRSCPCFT
ncbi:unnamed protein product, partial [Didymodactylos carnosus]